MKHPKGLGRIVALAALAASLYAAPAAFGPGVAQCANRLPDPDAARLGPGVRVSLAFVVTVCFDDVEYSIACRESGLSEAARRLEQIFIDNYTNGRAAGSLKLVFWVPVETQEQLRLLREVEDRATAAAAARLQSEHPLQYYRLSAWHDAANQEARSGRNWRHDWAGRTHEYEVGPSRYQLAQITSGGG